MTTSEIWETHSGDIRRYIYKKVRDESIADDLMHDVFIKLHHNQKTIKDTSKLKPWLYKVAGNAIVDYYKEENRRRFVHVKEDEFQEEPKEPEHTAKDCLFGILDSLPEKYRNPITLYGIKGKKQQTIANELQLPLPTVKSLIQRARKLVVKGYMDCCDFTLNKNGKLVGEIKEKQFCKVCNCE